MLSMALLSARLAVADIANAVGLRVVLRISCPQTKGLGKSWTMTDYVQCSKVLTEIWITITLALAQSQGHSTINFHCTGHFKIQRYFSVRSW